MKQKNFKHQITKRCLATLENMIAHTIPKTLSSEQLFKILKL